MKLIRPVIVLLLLMPSVGVHAQKSYTSVDFFTEKNIIWYGVDFTQCKFIGQPTIHGKLYKAPDYIVKYYMRDWNTIPIEEIDKYDIKATFEKEYVYFDVDTVMAHNKKYDPGNLISITSQYHLNQDLIPQMINGYSGVAKEGIGVVYIVESFNSDKEVATYFVVVFDIVTKKILMKDIVTGKPEGGSVKTYWAGAFRNALENSHKLYLKWKKGAMAVK